MTRPNARRLFLAVVAALATVGAARPAGADLSPDELALVVNSNEPAGNDLAQFYAQQRHVPDNRILVLDLPKGDDISAKVYAEQVVPQVREFLRSGGLESKVKCLVPFYGVPLRIDPRVNTPAEVAEVTDLRAQLVNLPPLLTPGIGAVEALARRLDPTFTPATGLTLDELDRRWATAVAAVSAQIPTVPDPARRAAVEGEFFTAAIPLLGTAAQIKAKAIDLGLHASRQPAELPALQAAGAAYNKTKADAGTEEATPEDPAARSKLRDLAKSTFGLLQYGRLLHDQLDYLDERHGGMAFDSELSLVRWAVHPHNYPGGNPYTAGVGAGHMQWFANPLYYVNAFGPRPPATPTMMVTRLDAPTPELVKAMIATSVRVEARGLHGRVVIDSLGAPPGQDPPAHKGYGPYDQTLRGFDEVLAGHRGIDVLFDQNEALLPPHAASDVALYVGWYAVNGYVPTCSFAGGAVAMHVASYTLKSLRTPGQTNWAAGLITDGAVATIGPVAEPFLFAFPHADDFFPLLMTGKLTLAECYWRTEPVASWQMTCIGDPLYNPYKADPQLTVADLPLRLRGLFHQATPAPTTAPVP